MISTKQSVSVCLIILVFLLCLHIKSCYVEIHTKKLLSNRVINNVPVKNNLPVKNNNVVDEANNIPEEVHDIVEEANILAEETNNVVDEEDNGEVNDVFDESNNVLDDSVYDKALSDELKTKIPYWLFNVQPKGPIESDSPINPYNAESSLGEVDFETDDSDSDSE